MEKITDYLISGIWFGGDKPNGDIAHVMVHLNQENFKIGHKFSVEKVIQFLKAGMTVQTVRWD